MDRKVEIKLPTCPECGSPLLAFEAGTAEHPYADIEFACSSIYRREGKDPWARVNKGLCDLRAEQKAKLSKISYDANGGVHTT